MLAIDRWRNWRPLDEKFGDSHEREPSKPSKPTFEGFEGSTSEQIQNFTDRAPDASDGDPLPGEWLLDRCIFRDRWWGGIGGLHLDLARWCAEHARPVPESRRVFVTALQADGFAVTTNGLVYGLVLREDVEAHQRFENPPVPALAPAQGKRRRRA